MSEHRSEGEVAAGESAIAAVVEAAADFARRRALAPLYRDRLAVVAEELVTNVIAHGRVAPDSRIRFAFEACADAVRVSLSDAGAAFDPRCLAESEVRGATPLPEREGGWGWPIILAWCKVVSYRREDGRNHLELEMPAVYQDPGAPPP